MTKPTDAQIEAAAKAAYSVACDDEDGYTWQDYIPVAKAALIAGARECTHPDCNCPQGVGICGKAALAAAAEVGGETFDAGYKYKEAECKDEIAATIERCAQVADGYDNGTDGGLTAAIIADAIRTLKIGNEITNQPQDHDDKQAD